MTASEYNDTNAGCRRERPVIYCGPPGPGLASSGEGRPWPIASSSSERAGEAGITLMHHPDNPPSPYFVRDYGTMCNNFILHQPYFLKAGEALQQRFRLLVHTGGPNDVDIDGYYAAFHDS